MSPTDPAATLSPVAALLCPLNDELLCSTGVSLSELNALRAQDAGPTAATLDTITRLCTALPLDARRLTTALMTPGIAFALHDKTEVWRPETPLHLVDLGELTRLCAPWLAPHERAAELGSLTVLFSPRSERAIELNAQARRVPVEQYRESQRQSVINQVRRDMLTLAQEARERGVTPQEIWQGRQLMDDLLPDALRMF